MMLNQKLSYAMIFFTQLIIACSNAQPSFTDRSSPAGNIAAKSGAERALDSNAEAPKSIDVTVSEQGDPSSSDVARA